MYYNLLHVSPMEYVALMQDEKLSVDAVTEYRKVIQEQSSMALQAVDRLSLALSAVNHGNLPTQSMESVDLNELIETLVAADNNAQLVKHVHSGESTASTGIRPSCPSHIDARGELRFDTPTGARKWRAKSDVIPSRIQCADTQEPRRTQMGNTKSAGKQTNDHMTKTGAKQKCVTDPARIGLSEAPMPSVNI